MSPIDLYWQSVRFESHRYISHDVFLSGYKSSHPYCSLITPDLIVKIKYKDIFQNPQPPQPALKFGMGRIIWFSRVRADVVPPLFFVLEREDVHLLNTIRWTVHTSALKLEERSETCLKPLMMRLLWILRPRFELCYVFLSCIFSKSLFRKKTLFS